MTQDYYGTKRVTAWPQERDGKPGYAVKYSDGYISWSPEEPFEEAYQPITGMSFGHAIVALEEGQKVARSGWNGKGMYLLHAGSGTFHINGRPEGKLLPFLVMRTVTGDYVPWLASQTDMLANDWQIVQ